MRTGCRGDKPGVLQYLQRREQDRRAGLHIVDSRPEKSAASSRSGMAASVPSGQTVSRWQSVRNWEIGRPRARAPSAGRLRRPVARPRPRRPARGAARRHRPRRRPPPPCRTKAIRGRRDLSAAAARRAGHWHSGRAGRAWIHSFPKAAGLILPQAAPRRPAAPIVSRETHRPLGRASCSGRLDEAVAGSGQLLRNNHKPIGQSAGPRR